MLLINLKTQLGLTLLLGLSSATISTDVYVQETQNVCYKTRETLPCLKYRVLRYASSFATGKIRVFNMENDVINENVTKLVRLSKTTGNEDVVFPGARQMDKDTEVGRIIKFIQRMVETFLKNHGVTFELNQEIGPRLIEENDVSEYSDDTKDGRIRRKRQRGRILFPLIVLFKLMKIQMMLIPIGIGVALLQKLFIIGAILATYFYSKLAVCKQHPPIVSVPTGHGHTHWASPEVASVDYSTVQHHYPDYPPNSYHEWAAKRAFNAYQQQYETDVDAARKNSVEVDI